MTSRLGIAWSGVRSRPAINEENIAQSDSLGSCHRTSALSGAVDSKLLILISKGAGSGDRNDARVPEAGMEQDGTPLGSAAKAS